MRNISNELLRGQNEWFKEFLDMNVMDEMLRGFFKENELWNF